MIPSFAQKLSGLRPRSYPLYLAAFLFSGLARLLVLLLPARTLFRLIGQAPAASYAKAARRWYRIDEVGLAVTRVAKYVPWRCVCLEQGLAAKMLLKSMGVPSTLVLGVRYDAKKKINAHAWLRCEDTYVTGRKGTDQFNVLAEFP